MKKKIWASFQSYLKPLHLKKDCSLSLSQDITLFSVELIHQQGQEALTEAPLY